MAIVILFPKRYFLDPSCIWKYALLPFLMPLSGKSPADKNSDSKAHVEPGGVTMVLWEIPLVSYQNNSKLAIPKVPYFDQVTRDKMSSLNESTNQLRYCR